MHLLLTSLGALGLCLAPAPAPAPGGEHCRQAAGKVDFAPAPGSPYRVGPMAGRPAVGDMNGDGSRDVVIACGICCGDSPKPESGHVVVLLNDGSGRLTAADARGGRWTRVLVGPSVRKVALADANGDGALDVFCAEHDTYDVTLLLGDGKGGLVEAPGSPFVAASGARPHTHEIASADLNGDGLADVLTTNANDNAISVLLGDGRGGLTPAAGSPFSCGRHPYDALAVADVDADGSLDVIAPLLAAGKIGVLRGDGRGGLTESAEHKYVVSERPGYVAAGDVNGDGRPDILASHDDVGVIDVLLNDGAGRFTFAEGSPLRVSEPAWGISIADVNGDGSADAVLGAFTRAPILLLGDGRGGFSEAAPLAAPAGASPNYVAVADLNADGRLDLVSGNYGSGDVSVFLQVAPAQ